MIRHCCVQEVRRSQFCQVTFLLVSIVNRQKCEQWWTGKCATRQNCDRLTFAGRTFACKPSWDRLTFAGRTFACTPSWTQQCRSTISFLHILRSGNKKLDGLRNGDAGSRRGSFIPPTRSRKHSLLWEAEFYFFYF